MWSEKFERNIGGARFFYSERSVEKIKDSERTNRDRESCFTRLDRARVVL